MSTDESQGFVQSQMFEDVQGFVQSQMLEDLQILVDNAERLSDIVNTPSLSAASPVSFARKVAEKLKLSESVVNDVLAALWRTKKFQKELNVGPQQTVDRISSQLESQAPEKWKAKHLDSWKECAPLLGRLLEAIDDDHPLLIAIKALNLAYTHQNILVRSKLLTDIRPVFDTDAEHIRELVVTHTLFITYSDASHSSCGVSFALDAEDVTNLLHECQRAATKTKTVKDALHKFNPIVLPERVNES